MNKTKDHIGELTTLNRIIETLNQAVDVRQVLQSALADLLALMDLETGWIFLVDEQAQDSWAGRGFTLSAYQNLPPALDLEDPIAWNKGCDCQGLCKSGKLFAAYNEVRCSRLSESLGDRRGLAVHASVPLRAGTQILGILNIASADWQSFTPQSLALLTNIGNQMGNSLERARLFDMLREQRIQEQAALLELSNQLLSRLDMEDMMAYLVEVVPNLIGADACALLLPAEDSHFLEFQVAKGWSMSPVDQKRQIPLDERSGPGTVMLTQEPLIAANIEQRDPAPWAPDWVLAEGFRGHAVIPLIAEGKSVGVMTINTRRPRQWDDHDMRFMRLMANQIALAIETARLHQEEIERQRLEEELAVGRTIQLSLLPEKSPEISGWEFAALHKSARQVSGDFYDFYDFPGDEPLVGMLIADVVDKGVPAALFMALSRTVIRTMALSGRGPAEALIKANDLILNDSRASMFLTAFYATLNTQNGHLVYANAGHNRPLWYHADSGKCQELYAEGSLLAVLEQLDLEEKDIHLQRGDILVLYTDGLTDAVNSSGEMFGEERLWEVIESNSGITAHEMLDQIMEAVEKYSRNTPLADDLTIIVISRVSS